MYQAGQQHRLEVRRGHGGRVPAQPSLALAGSWRLVLSTLPLDDSDLLFAERYVTLGCRHITVGTGVGRRQRKVNIG